jgi:hypothetical protein
MLQLRNVPSCESDYVIEDPLQSIRTNCVNLIGGNRLGNITLCRPPERQATNDRRPSQLRTGIAAYCQTDRSQKVE